MTPPGSEAEIPIDNAEMVGGAATKAAIVPLRACTWHFGGLVQNDPLLKKLSVQSVTIPVPTFMEPPESKLSAHSVGDLPHPLSVGTRPQRPVGTTSPVATSGAISSRSRTRIS